MNSQKAGQKRGWPEHPLWAGARGTGRLVGLSASPGLRPLWEPGSEASASPTPRVGGGGWRSRVERCHAVGKTARRTQGLGRGNRNYRAPSSGITVPSPGASHVDVTSPAYDAMQRALHACGFFPQIQGPVNPEECQANARWRRARHGHWTRLV